MDDERFYKEHYPRSAAGDSLYRKMMTRPRFRRLFEMTNVKRGDEVLEVGCATGTMLSMFEERGVEMHGIEIDPTAVEQADHPRITQGIAEDLPFEDGSFDACVSSHLIEHLESPTKFAKEAVRALKPGGQFAVIYPWEPYKGITIVPDLILEGKLPTPERLHRIHRHAFTPDKLQNIFVDLPLSHKSSKMFFGFPNLALQFVSVFMNKKNNQR